MILSKNYTKFILKNVLLLMLSAVIGFLFNYNITIELVRRFVFISDQLRIPLGILMLVFQIIIFFALIKLILERNIDSLTNKIIWICYFSMMVFLLFGRPIAGASINLNPFNMFYSLNNSDQILVSVFNVIFFIPIGFLFIRRKISYILAIMIPIEFLIESIQYLFKLGMFDVDDIILNILGICIGFFIFKNFNKIKIKDKKYTTINK
ncbi:VanZ family protein [Clostridium sp. UBA1652]|uniref:VanZ family protein n=1 Tax=Clostridium sp. UBA1652 TaxID=1946348 RepID=UPI00257AAB94|nr:VanZ family protein [Clostridium sp. UBA1652]